MATAEVMQVPKMTISSPIRTGIVSCVRAGHGSLDLDYFPRDVAKLITQNLADVDVNKMLRLNKTWNSVLQDEFFWKQKLLKDFPQEVSATELSECATGKMPFIELYKRKNLGPWATWLKDNLCSPTISMSWIISKDSLTYWGKSSFEARFKPGEAVEVVNALRSSKTSITIRGERYIVISQDLDGIKFRKGNIGGCILVTSKALIVCLHDQGKSLQSCLTQAEEIAILLRQKGY